MIVIAIWTIKLFQTMQMTENEYVSLYNSHSHLHIKMLL
jgi:hypothetical protein